MTGRSLGLQAMKKNNSERGVLIFNSPVECGVRTLVILAEAFPDALDLQRLLQYDYLAVHSGDAPGGPESIHPATPMRSGELLVRRSLLGDGIRLMAGKGLLIARYSANGITYVASEDAAAFLGGLSSAYLEKLRARASWVVNAFRDKKNDELEKFMRTNWDHWGTEFAHRQGTLFEAEI